MPTPPPFPSNRARYLVAGCKPWSRRVFDEQLRTLPGKWQYVSGPAELAAAARRRPAPTAIFFLHWSWIVPRAIVERVECVCFHMTDVPYGRGGSPLQNLILRGHRETRLSALRMTAALDAGPVYRKAPLSLEGSAEEIYLRANQLAAEMIRFILKHKPVPQAQSGRIVTFRRRKPAQSLIPSRSSLRDLHDFIRMLDADGYPQAALVHRGFRYEFSRASLYDGRIRADVTITPAESARP